MLSLSLLTLVHSRFCLVFLYLYVSFFFFLILLLGVGTGGGFTYPLGLKHQFSLRFRWVILFLKWLSHLDGSRAPSYRYCNDFGVHGSFQPKCGLSWNWKNVRSMVWLKVITAFVYFSSFCLFFSTRWQLGKKCTTWRLLVKFLGGKMRTIALE